VRAMNGDHPDLASEIVTNQRNYRYNQQFNGENSYFWGKMRIFSTQSLFFNIVNQSSIE
jgi:hypothetical protein